MLNLAGQGRGQAGSTGQRTGGGKGAWNQLPRGREPLQRGLSLRLQLLLPASSRLPPPPLAPQASCHLPHNPAAGATVSLHKPCSLPRCQGRPHSWAHMSLEDTDVAELSRNEVQKGHGAGVEENSGLDSQLRARRDARPQPPEANLLSCRGLWGLSGHWHSLRGRMLCAFVSGRPCSPWCGYVSSASKSLLLLELQITLQPSSWSSASMPQGNEGPPPLTMRKACVMQCLTRVRRGLRSAKESHCYSPKKLHQDAY